MPRYQVTLDGRTFVLEGDHPPSEAEARQAIGATKAEPSASNAQMSTEELQRANLSNRSDLPSVLGFLANAPASLGRFLKDSALGVVDTAKLATRAMQGQTNPIIGAQNAQALTRAVQQAPATLRTVGQALKSRYGGIDPLLHTAYTDPAGLAADVSTVTGAGAALTGGRAPRLARILRATSKASNPMAAVTRPIAKAADAASDVVIAGTLRPSKAIREDFGGRRGVAQAVKRERVYSEASAQKKLTQSKNEADDLLRAQEAAGTRGVSPRRLADALGDQPMDTANIDRRLGATAGMHGGDPTQTISSRQARIIAENAVPGQPGATRLIPLTDAQKMKRRAQQRAYDAGKAGVSLDKQAEDAIARALRQQIEARVPQVGPINERSQRLLGAQRAFSEAQDRPRTLTNFLSILAGTGGFLGGGPGGAAGLAALMKAADSPRAGAMAGIGLNEFGRGINAESLRQAALVARLIENTTK